MATQGLDIEVLNMRLQNLEWRLRATLIAWVVSLVMVVVLVAASQRTTSQPTVVRARAVEVVDETGRARIVLSADRVPGSPERRPGVTGIWLLDPSGRQLAKLTAAANGSSSLSYSDPTRPLQYGTFSLDGLILSDTAGKGRIQFMPDGISVWDSRRRMRVLFALQGNGDAGLTLFDPTGNLRIAVDVDHHGKPGLTVFDTTGRKLFGAP